MNPTHSLLEPWSGAHGGLPPFDRVTVADLGPAIDAAMALQLQEVEAIAQQSAPPDFDNTLVALEQSGRELDRVLAIYHVYCGSMSDEAIQQLEQQLEPRLAAMQDAITQNEALFARIAAVYHGRRSANLNAEQQRLCEVQYRQFARTGAALNAAGKTRLSAINQALASLFTEFSQRLLKDEDEDCVVLPAAADLAGLPDSEVAAAATEATQRGLPGQWVIANTRSAVEPFLAYAQRRDWREVVWRKFVERGARVGNDTRPLIKQILRLRAERAQLLGFATHAHWQLEDSMARTPARAQVLLKSMWPAALARVREEVADMQRLADADGVTIAAWDYRYYAEQVRRARFDLDANQLKPYLSLESLREGMFHVAQRLFGLRFAPLNDAPVYHPDVRVWSVSDAQGQHVGHWYFDPYARRGKQSGAWMTEYRSQHRLAGGAAPIVSNNANFTRGAPGEPVLINWDDAVTLFHEFGHALHGLLSNVTYASLAGTNVVRDFVEFPSQLLEHWLLAPEVLNRFARHVQTQQPMPAALVHKLMQARHFNQGFATLEYLASAVIDMELHLLGEAVVAPEFDVAAFERDTLARWGMPDEVVMRHRTSQFGHVFSGDGYAAGYYSYLWADTLVADAWEAFTECGDVFDPTLAQRLRDSVFTVGNQREPDMAYRQFRGRDADINALMRKRGFAASHA